MFPAEIERVIAAHTAVAMVAVGSQPNDITGEIAKAYVVLKPGAEIAAAAILDLCRGQLAAYKVPRAVQFVADLPSGPKARLDGAVQPNFATGVGAGDARTPCRSAISKRWSSVQFAPLLTTIRGARIGHLRQANSPRSDRGYV